MASAPVVPILASEPGCHYACHAWCGPLPDQTFTASFASPNPAWIAECFSGALMKASEPECALHSEVDPEEWEPGGDVELIDFDGEFSYDECFPPHEEEEDEEEEEGETADEGDEGGEVGLPSPPRFAVAAPPSIPARTMYRLRADGFDAGLWRVKQVDFGCSFVGGLAAEPAPPPRAPTASSCRPRRARSRASTRTRRRRPSTGTR